MEPTAPSSVPISTEVDFKLGQLGPALQTAEPLLYLETHAVISQRQAQQRRWCDELQVLGVQSGSSESYTNWTLKQAPFMTECLNYTGDGVHGVGQAGCDDEATFAPIHDRWIRLKIELINAELEYTDVHRSDNPDLQDLTGRLLLTEVASLCNLTPGDAEEACAVIPALTRFTADDITRECERVAQTAV